LRAIIPLLSGVIAGSLFEFGTIGANMFVIGVGKANGSTTCAIDLLSNTKVTVCGSGTGVGLYHVTLSPDLISTWFGENS
jgi:hypothetical protein